MKTVIVILFFSAILIKFDFVYAQEDVRSPFILKELNVTHSKANQNGKIYLKVETVADGEVSFEFHANEKIKKRNEPYDKILGKHSRSKAIELDLPLNEIEDGFHFVELGMGFKPENTKKDKVASYQTFPLYFQIKDGEVIEQGDKPNELFNKPPTIIDKDELKTKAVFKQPKKGETKSFFKVEQVGASYDIYIYIYGRVRYQQTSQISGVSAVYKGLPDSRVRIDWDADNNPSTGYTPYDGQNLEHVEWADTDMDGNFYFSFIFSTSQPANYYASFLRLYGDAASEATFNGDRGPGAQFVPQSGTEKLSLSGLTDYVVGEVNPTIEANEGSALRHIFRAQQFSKNSLGFTPNAVRFYIRTGATSSYFCQYGGTSGTGCGVVNTSLPYILFNLVVGSWLGYHEYGHFIEWNKAGYQLTDPPIDNLGHWFARQTTENIAWTEGWAEFYNAACHDFWYSTELPVLLEHETRDWSDENYEFLDAGQVSITPGYNRDNTKVEGAVASFIYSLWDGVARRAPNYSGDNDDATLSGSYIMERLQFNYSGFGSSRIEKFKNGISVGLNTDNTASINSLYSYMIQQSGSPRSSTPTTLNINSTLRSLSWNDNTCPSFLQYQREGSNFYSYYSPIRNQEQGFKVYRKTGGGTWDGTLNGYSHIATVGANITSWTDETYLIGTYSYVVVAYNSSGNSIPRAQAVVTYNEGEIESNVTMSGDISISNNITVFSDATLTISPGTILRFCSGGNLIVNGKIIAIGTAQSPVTFTSQSGTIPGSWGSIILNGSGASGSTMNYAHVENGTEIKALNVPNFTINHSTISNMINGVNAYNSNGWVMNSAITMPQDHGIIANNSTISCYYNTITKTNHTGAGILYTAGGGDYIYQNSISGFEWGVGSIYGSFPYFGHPSNSGVNNYIQNCSEGIRAYQYSGIYMGDDDPDFTIYGYSNFLSTNTYHARVYNYSNVYAEYNYWGQYPPNASKFSIYGGGTMDYSNALDYNTWYPSYAMTNPSENSLTMRSSSIQLPTQTNHPFKLAMKLRKQNKYGEAFASLKEAIAKEENVSSALLAVASLYNDTLKTEIEDYLSKVSVSKSPLAAYLYGDILARKQMNKEAIASFSKITSTSPLATAAMLSEFYVNLNNVNDIVRAKEILTKLQKGNTESDVAISLAQHDFEMASGRNERGNEQINNTSVQENGFAQNYPNPFNPTTTIGFTLEKTGMTTLKIYDAIGREVATLVNEVLDAGVYHQKQFDASHLASGIYFARLVSDGKVQVKKLMLMK